MTSIAATLKILSKGDNNESLLDDVIAAASSTSATSAGEKQIETGILESRKECLSSEIAKSGVKPATYTFEAPVVTTTTVTPETTTTSATTIATTVSPIVIPCFKVRMGNQNKLDTTGNRKTETLLTAPSGGTCTASLQGVYHYSSGRILQSFFMA